MKIKKVFLGILIVLMLFSVSYADETVKVSVDGKVLNFNVEPTVIEGRTLVPVRAIFEALGVKVGWNNETQTVTGQKNDISIELPIGKKFAKKNGKQIELEVPATIINDSTMVPARFIAESVGAKVEWNGETRTILIKSSSNQDIKVHFIDVGQADSIYIQGPNNYDILIDGGNNSDGDLVVNYLKNLQVDDIEIMIATHAHEDHIGGLDNVLAAYKVENVIDSGDKATTKTYEDYWEAVQTENTTYKEDDNLSFSIGDGIEFEVMELGDGFSNTNDNSVVCMLDYGDTEFLFMGDLESDVEKSNLDEFSDIDVLKLGHHGSKTSTSRKFLDVVKPEFGIISCGVNNKYGHPNSETLVKLNEYGVKTFRTDEQGSIICITDGQKVEFNTKPTQINVSGNITNQENVSNESTKKSKNIAEKSYVGSKKSSKYHFPSCRWAKKIQAENLIEFSSKEDAESKGYEPCGTCNP